MPTKQQELDEIAKEIAACKICPVGKIGKPVPGEGNAEASVMLVGEAPGRLEAETGRPFVGRSGKLLRSMLADIGLKEDEVYITSPVKYLPSYGTPKKSDITHGKMHFDKQVAVIDPKIIVVMGSVASQALLTTPISVTAMHGKTIHENGRIYFILFHPAAALRFPPTMKFFKEDFRKLQTLLKKEKLVK